MPQLDQCVADGDGLTRVEKQSSELSFCRRGQNVIDNVGEIEDGAIEGGGGGGSRLAAEEEISSST